MRLSRPAALAAAVMLTQALAGGLAAPAQAAELVAVSEASVAQIYQGPHGPIVLTATAKAFRAAPQNGSNNLLVVYSCNVAGAGDGTVTPVRSQVPTCFIDTDGPAGSDRNYDGQITQGPAATSTGQDTLVGNRANICIVGAVRYSDGTLGANPSPACGTVTLAV